MARNMLHSRRWMITALVLGAVALAAIVWATLAWLKKPVPSSAAVSGSPPSMPQVPAPPQIPPESSGTSAPPSQPAAKVPAHNNGKEQPSTTPDEIAKEYSQNLQKSISQNVNAQVAEALRQSSQAMSAVGIGGKAGDAQGGTAREAKPCAKITQACRDAGFEKDAASSGKGIGFDCIYPIMQGKPQPGDASLPLPHVSPELIAACKAMNPSYGRLPKKNGNSSGNSPGISQ